MKYRLLSLCLPFALIACSPDDGEGGDSSSDPLVIDESNKSMLIDTALGNFSGEGSYDDPFSGFSGLLIDDPTGSSSGQSRSLSERASETVNCHSGSASVTTSGFDVGSGTPPADGSASFSANYNDCNFSESNETYSFSMTIDGSISADLQWTGYDSGTDSFDSYSMSMNIDDFSFVMNSNGDEVSFAMDFESSVSKPAGSNTVTYSYDGTFGVPPEGYVEIDTITPITVDLSLPEPKPISGEVVFRGDNNTSIRYTVVSNGIEVSVNEGPGEVKEWDEI